ncbi:hypothetical protein QET40_00015, partial [Akkermansia sp. N21169]|uniref:hypothetical protein n=1 Tax=Akkermansia sp. N21169 TaxID=3040765 RepID=UPI00244EDB5B
MDQKAGGLRVVLQDEFRPVVHRQMSVGSRAGREIHDKAAALDVKTQRVIAHGKRLRPRTGLRQRTPALHREGDRSFAIACEFQDGRR